MESFKAIVDDMQSSLSWLFMGALDMSLLTFLKVTLTNNSVILSESKILKQQLKTLKKPP